MGHRPRCCGGRRGGGCRASLGGSGPASHMHEMAAVNESRCAYCMAPCAHHCIAAREMWLGLVGGGIRCSKNDCQVLGGGWCTGGRNCLMHWDCEWGVRTKQTGKRKCPDKGSCNKTVAFCLELPMCQSWEGAWGQI